MKWKVWLKGLISAAVGAFATGVSLVIVDPMDYNLADPVATKRLLMVCAVNAIIAVAMYLKRSPLPNDNNIGAGAKALLLIFLASSLSLGGCAHVVKLSEREIEDVDKAVQASENFLYDWPMFSGLIRGTISKAVMDAEFPANFGKALNELDEMAKDCKRGDDDIVSCGLEDWTPADYEGDFPYSGNPEAMKRYAAGAHYGIKARMLGQFIWKTLEKYAGDVFKLLPALF